MGIAGSYTCPFYRYDMIAEDVYGMGFGIAWIFAWQGVAGRWFDFTQYVFSNEFPGISLERWSCTGFSKKKKSNQNAAPYFAHKM